MSVSKETIELMLGGIFILVHSYDRYNKPSTNRLSTTAFRFHLSAIIYASIYLIFYYIFTKYPSFLKIFQIGEIGGTPGLLDTLNELPPALLVALILTIFIEKIAFVKSIDARLRDFLQKSAEIPFEAMRLASQLRSADMRFDQNNTMALVSNKLIEEGIKDTDVVFTEKPSHDDKSLLSRITAITLQLEAWEKDRTYIRFIQEHRANYNSIFNRYSRLLKKARLCFDLNDDEFAELDSPKAMIASKECKSSFMEQCRALFATECEFISHAILSSNVTEKARAKALADLGFNITTTHTTSGLSINQITTLMVFVFAIAGTVFVLGSEYIANPKTSMFFGLMVGIIFTVSTACVTYTKCKWSIAKPEENGTRPTLYYLLVGLLAVVLTIPVTVIFKTVFDMNITQHASIANIFSIAWENVVDNKWPYKIVVFVSAFSLAWLIDNKPYEKLKTYQWQIVEGSINAIAILCATLLAKWMINDFKPLDFENGSILVTLARNTMIGFLIGFLVPNWFRKAVFSGHRKEIEDSATFISKQPTINVTEVNSESDLALQQQ